MRPREGCDGRLLGLTVLGTSADASVEGATVDPFVPTIRENTFVEQSEFRSGVSPET